MKIEGLHVASVHPILFRGGLDVIVHDTGKLFASMGMEAALLTSAMTAKAKQAVLDGLANGQIQVVIGTHALIQETVQFKQLGLVIIDEQHRFWVGQKQKNL